MVIISNYFGKNLWPKKITIYPGTQGRKNTVLKMPIDLTGINKVPIVCKCRWAKSLISNSTLQPT